MPTPHTPKAATLLWFPLRISYSSASRLMRLKKMLDAEDDVAQTYVPMEFRKVGDKMQFAPAIDNLIFVRATADGMSTIKARKSSYEPLRYIMHPVMDDKGVVASDILLVPDKRMDDFIRVTSERNDKIVYLDNLDFACKPGQHVQVTEGPFAGVKGVIKRIHGNVCVVIAIKGTIAVAITGLPRKFLRYLDADADDE